MKRFLPVLLIVPFALACNEEEKNNPVIIEPAITAPGIPVGNAVTKVIGSDGGNLSSVDGRIEIEIPEGALNNTVAISIQEITNEAPGGIGLAYRFLPDETTFSKAVTLKFHYTDEDLAGSAVEAMGIAVQASDGSWRTPYDFEFNESSRTVFATTTHFTDFAFYEMYKLILANGSKDTLRVKETADLHVMTLRTFSQEQGEDDLPPLPSGDLSNEDELPPLPVWRLSSLQNITWLVNSKSSNTVDGTIVDDVEPAIARYTAPETVPPLNPVLITATLSNVLRRTDRLILGSSIYIKPDEYNFILELQLRSEFPCGLPGQVFRDLAEMSIQVIHNTVTTTNIVNHPAAVIPTQVGIEGTQCTVTCIPGPTGIVNITEVSGNIIPGTNGKATLYLDFKNIGATSMNQRIECPDVAPTVADYHTYDHNHPVNFILKDSTQIHNDGPFGYLIKLTPQ